MILEMGLEKESKIIQSKNAHTQYVTIPAIIVQDSQYPFRDGGKVKINVEPDYGVIIISREGVQLKKTKYGVLLLKKGFVDLPSEFEIEEKTRE